jgi:hypothetical protein
MQLSLIESLNVSAPFLARQVACRWLRTTFEAWNSTGFMFEKYNAFDPGQGGGGGECEPQ